MNTLTPSPTGLSGRAQAAMATWAGGCSAFIAACASAPVPTEQRALSTAAVAHAVTAGAPEFAPAELRVAQEKLDRANTAVGTNDHERALSLAQEAQADAALAEAKSESSKARKAADALREGSKALREEMDRKAK